MVEHFCTCNKNSPRLVMPRYERVFSPAQTFAHFFVMRYLNASSRVMSREHDMPSERWLQASQETEEQITTRILWKNFYPPIRNWGAICPWKSTFWVLIWISLRWFCEWRARWRTLQQWRADTKGNGARHCLLIIAGTWCMVRQIRRSIGRRRRPECNRAIRRLRLMT